MHPLQLIQRFMRQRPHTRILVHREIEMYIREIRVQRPDRAEDLHHRLAQILATMRRQQHLATGHIQHLRQFRVKGKILLHRQVQRIDHRIARRVDRIRVHALAQEIFPRLSRRRKMHRRQLARQLAVRFLRKRRIHISAAKPSLHMTNRHLLVEARQRTCERRRRIPVHQHKIRLFLDHNALNPAQHPHRDIHQRLVLLHQVQIVARRHIKKRQHLVQHLAMLRRHNNQRLQILRLFHRLHKRRHLDRFRTRPENKHNLFHSYTSFIINSRYSPHNLSFFLIIA